MNEINYGSIIDETNSGRNIIMPKIVQGPSTPEVFETIVRNDFIEPYNMLCLDRQDIRNFCSQQGVFDTLRIESSLETLGSDVADGIQTICAAHNGKELQSMILQITAMSHDMFTLDMMKTVNKAFRKLYDTIEIKWGMALNQDDMKAECGIYIIANFM